jgi:hypothetical protein
VSTHSQQAPHIVAPPSWLGSPALRPRLLAPKVAPAARPLQQRLCTCKVGNETLFAAGALVRALGGSHGHEGREEGKRAHFQGRVGGVLKRKGN